MSKTEVVRGKAHGAKIADIVDRISHVLVNESPVDTIFACLATSFIMMKPDIKPAELIAGVNATSEYIVLQLSPVPNKVTLAN